MHQVRRMKFYKIRAYIVFLITVSLTFLFRVDTPPLVSVAAIIKKKKKVLVIDLSYMDGYGLPGGVVQRGETLDDALAREIKEETGLEVVKLEYWRSYTSSIKGLPQLAVIYIVVAKGKLIKSREGKPVWAFPNAVIDNSAYGDTKDALLDYIKEGLI